MKSETFKAAVLHDTSKPLEIRELLLPELKRGQVVVKIFYSGVCHSQLMEAKGLRGEDKYLPHLLGHEATGEVVSVGDEVSKVKIGDRVVLGWIKGDGIDAGGAQYLDTDGNTINSGAVTTFSEYSVVSENRLTLLPKHTPADLGVLYGCAMLTGAGVVKNELKPEPGKTLAVFGIGGIGMSAFLLATHLKLDKLIVVDVEQERLDLAKKLGATHTINAKDTDVLAMLKTITGSLGLDYIAEATGKNFMIEMAFKALNRNGKLVFASHPKAGDLISIDPFELICGKHISGSWGGCSQPDIDIPYYDALYHKGELPLEFMLTKRYALEEVNDALADLENGKVIRALLEIWPQ